MLQQPVEAWPVCEVLIAFHSKGFPLIKAVEYVKLRRPICFNDLERAHILLDRRSVYATLRSAGLPTPAYVVHDHTDPARAADLLQHEDFIEVRGVRISKPFVEKPIDADDHRIHIYYPDSVGGGSKRLFRKVPPRTRRT
jgi:inositol-hexakisphosphate/diphosphoinositol-pentakisphosphate 1-kinase